MEISNIQIERIIGPIIDDEKLSQITKSINQTFRKYDINTPLRKSHFLAQILHESCAFRFNSEISIYPSVYQAEDAKTYLNNILKTEDDEYKYRGRGWIQLAGKTNYKLASTEFGQDFIKNPDLASTTPWNAFLAGWFWFRKGLNFYADKDDLVSITKHVNGGFNGLDERYMWLMRTKRVLFNIESQKLNDLNSVEKEK